MGRGIERLDDVAERRKRELRAGTKFGMAQENVWTKWSGQDLAQTIGCHGAQHVRVAHSRSSHVRVGGSVRAVDFATTTTGSKRCQWRLSDGHALLDCHLLDAADKGLSARRRLFQDPFQSLDTATGGISGAVTTP